MHVIAISNQKGGCGKTTTAINLAASLSAQGKRTLLIDLDPQGHATLGMGADNRSAPHGLNDAIAGRMTLGDIAQTTRTEGLDLLPATAAALAEAERAMATSGDQGEVLLASLLDPIADRYDYAVIDCPPTLGLLCLNGLMAAEQVVIPLEMSLFALDGVDRLCEAIDMMGQSTGHRPVLHVVPTLVDNRSRLSRALLRQVWERFADEISPVMIPYTVRLREAVSAGMPVREYDPASPAARQYDYLAIEVMDSAARHAVKPVRKVAVPVEEIPAAEIPLVAANPESAMAAAFARAHVLSATVSERCRVVFNVPVEEGAYVQIAGEFNDWVPDRGVNTLVADGAMRKELFVPPGSYQYAFIVNGEWHPDDSNPERVTNPWGGVNSILRVSQ